MEAARLVVEVGDPQALPARVLLGEAIGEEAPRSGKAVEGDGDVGTLMSHCAVLPDGLGRNDWNRLGFGGE